MDKASLNTEKRLRARNFTELEKALLLELLKKFPIIVSKDKTSKANSTKSKAWDELLAEFNANSQVTERDLDSLKACVGNMLIKAKKEDAIRKRELTKTGGGPYASQASTSNATDVLSSLMPAVFQPVKVDDSDTTCKLDRYFHLNGMFLYLLFSSNAFQ